LSSTIKIVAAAATLAAALPGTTGTFKPKESIFLEMGRRLVSIGT
jgi:hypothetical protein